jgi:two-component system, LytTR family, response regulator
MNAIIIDDEFDCVKLLSLQLKMCCPHITVIAECIQSLEGLKCIQNLKPDIVFLDIEMPRMNGFQLLEALDDIDFALVFVTAYDKFAVKAFRYSAVDYLLKPIDTKDLQDCVKKIEKQKRIDERQLSLLKSQYASPQKILPDKIALPFKNGVTFVAIVDILYCESDDNYTKFYLKNGTVSLVSKTLRDIQEILEERNFLRVHRQYLVNLDQINRYVKGEGNYLIMNNDASIPVARNQKERLVERFGWL